MNTTNPTFQDRMAMIQQNQGNQRATQQHMISPLGNYSNKEIFAQLQPENPIIKLINSIINSVQSRQNNGQTKRTQAPITPTPTFVSPLPQNTPTPTPSPTPRITPYPTPSLSSDQKDFAKFMGPPLNQAISYNEGSLSANPPPNINPYEETYGPAGINVRAHPQYNQQRAENPQEAKTFLANRLDTAKKIFPDNIEKQILYYNVPANAYKDPNKLSKDAVWYLQNALKYLGQVPSEEYLPILQKHGFFK